MSTLLYYRGILHDFLRQMLAHSEREGKDQNRYAQFKRSGSRNGTNYRRFLHFVVWWRSAGDVVARGNVLKIHGVVLQR